MRLHGQRENALKIENLREIFVQHNTNTWDLGAIGRGRGLQADPAGTTHVEVV